MPVVLSTYGSRWDVEPSAGLAMRSPVVGAKARGCAPLDFAERAAELVAAQFDTVAAAPEGRDAPVATGVMRAGVWL